MKKLLALTMLPLAALLLLGAAACGGDDDDDSGDEGADATATVTEDGSQSGGMESYFVALEEILIRSDKEQEGIGDRLNQTYDTDEEYVTAAQEAFTESGQLLEASVLEISELDPPKEAQQAHTDYLDSLQSALILLSRLGTEVESADTTAEIDDAAEQFGSQITDQNVISADKCLELQGIAEANNVDVDLECST